MKRYIDADAVLLQMPDDLPYKGSVKRVLMQAPTIDAVEVVRCRDCKHGFNTERTTNILYCTRYIIAICKPNDFCSYGERRESDG